MKEWLASLPVSTLLLVIFASILFLVLLAYLGYLAWRSWKRLDELELKDRFAARNDFIKTTAQILGGAFFLITIYFTYQNLLVSEKNLAETQEKNKADLSIARDKQTTELYVKAIEQLGSDKLEVRLGGIYALERIAQNSPKDHWSIIEVLTAYIRENAPWPPEKFEVSRKKRPWAKHRDREIWPAEPPDTDIQAALTVLGQTAVPFAQKQVKFSLTSGFSLKLKSTNLAGAELAGANFLEASLWKANLQNAHFGGTNLQGADLRETNLQGAIFYGANLQKAHLAGANLRGALLLKVNLKETGLGQANLKGACLRGPEDIDLDTKGLTPEQVAGAFWDETTQWPKGFTPPAPRRDPPAPPKEGQKEGK